MKVRLDREGQADPARANRERRIASADRRIHARGQRSRRAANSRTDRFPTDLPRSRESRARETGGISRAGAELSTTRLAISRSARSCSGLLASTRGKPEEQALKIGLLKSLKRARYAAATSRPLRSGQEQLHSFHQSDPALRRFGRASRRWRNAIKRAVPATDIGQIASASPNTFPSRNVSPRKRRCDSVKMKKLEFFQRQLDATRSAGLSRHRHRREKFWPRGRTARRSPDRSDPRLLFDRRFLCLQSPRNGSLIGRQSRRRFSVGDELRVFVARVDVFKRQVDFAIADRSAANRPRDGQSRRRLSLSEPFRKEVLPMPMQILSSTARGESVRLRLRSAMDNIIEAKEASNRAEAFSFRIPRERSRKVSADHRRSSRPPEYHHRPEHRRG